MSLVSNANVYNTCLLLLRERGFSLRIEGELDDEGCYPHAVRWLAEKGEFLFIGDTPVELLGLASLYDHVKPAQDTPYWWRKEGEDIWDELQIAAFADANGRAPEASQ